MYFIGFSTRSKLHSVLLKLSCLFYKCSIWYWKKKKKDQKRVCIDQKAMENITSLFWLDSYPQLPCVQGPTLQHNFTPSVIFRFFSFDFLFFLFLHCLQFCCCPRILIFLFLSFPIKVLFFFSFLSLFLISPHPLSKWKKTTTTLHTPSLCKYLLCLFSPGVWFLLDINSIDGHKIAHKTSKLWVRRTVQASDSGMTDRGWQHAQDVNFIAWQNE